MPPKTRKDGPPAATRSGRGGSVGGGGVPRGGGAPRGGGVGRGGGVARAGGSQDVVVDSEGLTSSSDNHGETCGLCSVATGNDSIGCDKCPQWFHPTTMCTGLKLNTIICIQEEGGDAVRFVCSACRCKGNLQLSSDTSSSPSSPMSDPAMLQLFNIVKSVAESVAQMTQQVNHLVNISQKFSPSSSNSPSAVSQNSSQNILSRENLYVEMREFEERQKRRDSVVVRGIRGGSDQEFSQAFGNVASSILDRRVMIDPSNVYCINRENCLYRVKISNRDTRSDILTNARSLANNPNYVSVYISRDLTYMQRQELRLRRVKMHDRVQNPVTSVVGMMEQCRGCYSCCWYDGDIIPKQCRCCYSCCWCDGDIIPK